MENSDQRNDREWKDPRVPLAAERTLLAWIRTGLALMGFGFIVARFGLFLHEMALARNSAPARPMHISLWVGTAFVVLGVAVNVLSAVRHVRMLGRLERHEGWRPWRLGMGVVLSLLLAILGAVLAAYLVLVR